MGKKKSKFVAEQRIKELKAKSHDILAEYAYELEEGWEDEKKVVEKLESEIERKNLIISAKDKTIEELKNKKNPTHKFDGYDKSKTGVEKIQFILGCNKKAMFYNEIKDTLLLLEPELKERWADVNRAVTDLLAKAYKYKVIIKTEKYGRRFLYSLPETL